MERLVPYQLKGRNFGLDLFRVMAEFSVLLAHFLMWVAYAEKINHMDFMLIIGTIGLEFFFVMSGFLIGGMLLNITERGVTIGQWAEFTIRRLLRVMPPYLVWLGVLWFFFPPEDGMHANIFHFLTFTQNFAWASLGGHWFDVSWSLSVEFWFYLAFGASSLLAFKYVGKFGFISVIILFIVCPMIGRAIFHHVESWDSSIRKVVVFQLDAIAYGVILAYVLRRYDCLLEWRKLLAICGAAILFSAVLWWWWSESQFNVQLFFNKVFILNFVLLGIILIFPWVLHIRCMNLKLVMVIEWLSDSSYAVYLVHLTVAGWFVSLLAIRQPVLFIISATLASLVLGGISLYCIERPILRRRPKIV